MSPASHETPNIFPSLSYDDAQTAIDWLCRAFGFTARLVVEGPAGTVTHSELSLDSGVIMVSSSKPDAGRVSPGRVSATTQGVCVRVDDPDAHCTRAVAAGATIVRAVQDEEYGSRGYMARDPEGHLWYFGTYQPGGYWKDGEVVRIGEHE